MKKFGLKAIATLLITAFVSQNVLGNIDSVHAISDVETIYSDGIAFDVVVSKEGIAVNGSYDGKSIELSYDGEDVADATISEGIFEQEEYSLKINDNKDIMDDIDIDAIENASSQPLVKETKECYNKTYVWHLFFFSALLQRLRSKQ